MKKALVLPFLIFLFSLALNSNAQTGLNFDGTNDYISSSYTGIIGNADRTIEAWIRTTANSIPGQGGQKVIANWGTMSTGTRFTFNVLWGNAIRLEIGGSGISGNTPVNDGNWHHVAVSYTGGLVSLYVDGILDTTGRLTGTNTSSGGFAIGRRVDGINYFEGDIDEIRIWNTALSASQLSINDSNEICVPPANLVAYYKFNEGLAAGNNTSINSVIDEAGTNNGTLHNFALNGNGSNYVSSPLMGSDLQLSQTITSCGPYTAINGQTYLISGLYQDTLANSGPCDTILSLNLTIVNLDSSASRIASNQLQANETDTNASFQWLDCNDGLKAIQGVRNRTFNLVQNGSYAVEVTLNGCKDTSACIDVTNLGEIERTTTTLEIFPNPTNGSTQMTYPIGIFKYYEIYNVNGKLLRRNDLDQSSITTLDLKTFPRGVYLVKVKGKAAQSSQKIILE